MIVYELEVNKPVSNMVGSYEILMENSDFEKNLVLNAEFYDGQKIDKGYLCDENGKAVRFDITLAFKEESNRDNFFKFVQSQYENVSVSKKQYTV